MKTLLTVGLSNEETASLSGLLIVRGWEIRTAENCIQVLLRLRERRYHAVICETSLQDGDWMDVLDELWSCTTPTPLIVISPFADAHLWAEVLHVGGHDVLPFPFEAGELIRVLERAAADKGAGESWEPPALIAAGSLYDGDA